MPGKRMGREKSAGRIGLRGKNGKEKIEGEGKELDSAENRERKREVL